MLCFAPHMCLSIPRWLNHTVWRLADLVADKRNNTNRLVQKGASQNWAVLRSPATSLSFSRLNRTPGQKQLKPKHLLTGWLATKNIGAPWVVSFSSQTGKGPEPPSSATVVFPGGQNSFESVNQNGFMGRSAKPLSFLEGLPGVGWLQRGETAATARPIPNRRSDAFGCEAWRAWSPA